MSNRLDLILTIQYTYTRAQTCIAYAVFRRITKEKWIGDSDIQKMRQHFFKSDSINVHECVYLWKQLHLKFTTTNYSMMVTWNFIENNMKQKISRVCVFDTAWMHALMVLV